MEVTTETVALLSMLKTHHFTEITHYLDCIKLKSLNYVSLLGFSHTHTQPTNVQYFKCKIIHLSLLKAKTSWLNRWNQMCLLLDWKEHRPFR